MPRASPLLPILGLRPFLLRPLSLLVGTSSLHCHLHRRGGLPLGHRGLRAPTWLGAFQIFLRLALIFCQVILAQSVFELYVPGTPAAGLALSWTVRRELLVRVQERERYLDHLEQLRLIQLCNLVPVFGQRSGGGRSSWSRPEGPSPAGRRSQDLANAGSSAPREGRAVEVDEQNGFLDMSCHFCAIVLREGHRKGDPAGRGTDKVLRPSQIACRQRLFWKNPPGLPASNLNSVP